MIGDVAGEAVGVNVGAEDGEGLGEGVGPLACRETFASQIRSYSVVFRPMYLPATM